MTRLADKTAPPYGVVVNVPPKTMEVRGEEMKKVGIFLTVIGVSSGIFVILMVVVGRAIKQSFSGELNVRLSAFTSFVLDLSDLIRLHAVVSECLPFAFFVGGLLVMRHAGLELNSK